MTKVYRSRRRPIVTPIAVDLFSGSGAVTAALKAAGYNVACAVDLDKVCARTFRENHPEVKFLREDIRRLQPSKMLQALPRNCKVDLMVVCAPCQPFSSQNRRRSHVDARAPLILEAVRFAKVIKPRVIIFENVPGLAASPIFRRLKKALAAAGYSLGEPRRIDAADFGVPQRRVRCIVAAVRGAAKVREFAHLDRAAARVTVRQAFKGLRSLGPGQKDDLDRMHASRTHQAITLERLEHIPTNGGSRISLPVHLQLRCHQGRPDGDFCDVYGRMRWDDVAPTLTTGCTDVTKGRYAHPEDHRAITLREAARLQTFPDTYRFCGNRSEIAQQIGNAVPPEMIRRLIKAFVLAHPLI